MSDGELTAPVPRAIPELAAARDPNAPHVLHFDLETRSACDLRAAGAWRYAADASTEVVCCAYAVDGEPAQTWMLGDPVPSEFVEAAVNPNWLIASHNNQFEFAIETCVLAPRLGWPVVPLTRRRCTMAAALACALPGSLDGVAAALGLPHRKDKAGQDLMRRMAKPLPGGGWLDDVASRERLARYCIADVEVERELYKRLPPLSADEQILWQLDARINARGFHVDVELAKAAQAIVEKSQAAIDAEIAALTGNAIETAGQVTKIAAYVRERGHQLKGLTKRSVSAVLAQKPPDDVRRLLELRRDGALSSARKTGALLAGVDVDGRMRGTLRFHAASTGRWSATRFQAHNLKRPEIQNLDAAVDAILAGDVERVRELGSPLSVVGDVMRAMIDAAPGHALIAGDFSTIEARVLAWFAGEDWKLDAFRRFDATGDPALDPYLVAAARILKRPVPPDDEAGRHFGKTNELSFGFGGALGAWRRFDPDAHTDAEVERYKSDWRNAHPATTDFWHQLEKAVKRAVRTGRRGALGCLGFEFDSGTLRIQLPSGRAIAYPEARLVPGKFADTTQLAFMDNARGGWAEVKAWHGTLVENVVSATARDLLALAMTRIEAAGLPIVLTVHDEIVSEVPEGTADLAAFKDLMVAPPTWAAGLPIAAKVRVGQRYSKKSKAKPQTEPAVRELPPVDDELDEKVYADDF